MQILNVGPWEFFFILLIMLIVLGPDNMVKTGRQLGRWVYKLVRSPLWAQLMDTSKEIRNLPAKIVREAGVEEITRDIHQEVGSIGGAVTAELQAATREVDAAAQEMSAQSETLSLSGQPAPREDLNNAVPPPAPVETSEESESFAEAPIQPPERSTRETGADEGKMPGGQNLIG